MGKKKSEEETAAGGSSCGIGFLFSSDNPFCRKADPDPNPISPRLPPREVPTSGPSAEKDGGSASSNKRKKEKSVKPLVAVSDHAVVDMESPVKRKKTMNDEEVLRGNRKKRKRREVEEEYETKKYGVTPEETEKNGGERQGLGVTVGKKRKAEEAQKEIVVREEAFDDERKLLRTVFVGNLPLKTRRKAIVKEFAVFGEIESVRIRSVPIVETKAPRKAAIFKGQINDSLDSVHAYVVFKDEQSARAALGHNMAKVGGNHIRVDMACPPRKKLKGQAPIYSVKKTVFVGNLPYDVKDEELYQLFVEDIKMESSLEGIRVIRDPATSVGKGIAYVLFKTREAANSVVKKKALKLRDRELRLAHASKVDANTPSKRKTSGSLTPEFAKKHAVAKSATHDNYKGTEKVTPLSYQGLRSSKTGVLKKTPKIVHQVNSGSKRSGAKQKVRSEKRPAVAARKTLALKRKQDGGTPENFHRTKKARHSR